MNLIKYVQQYLGVHMEVGVAIHIVQTKPLALAHLVAMWEIQVLNHLHKLRVQQ